MCLKFDNNRAYFFPIGFFFITLKNLKVSTKINLLLCQSTDCDNRVMLEHDPVNFYISFFIS